VKAAKVSIRRLSAAFEGKQVLADIDLDVYPGEFLCIVGPSGCGKSTLLNVVGGFLPAAAGTVTIDGEPVRGPDPRRIFVFQESSVFPWLTVERNIGFGLAHLEAAERDARVHRYVKLVGLAGFEKAFPHELSGGMKQRCEVARALAVNPDILYMDEPFGALDFITRMTMRTELLRIWTQERKTVLFVTHDIDEAVQLADRVLVMSARPARVRGIFEIAIPHARDVNAPEYLDVRTRIMDELGVAHRL